MKKTLELYAKINFRVGGKYKKGGSAPAPAARAPATSIAACKLTAKAPAPAALPSNIPPDINLPLRYMKSRLDDEEIDIITNGGVADPPAKKNKK